MDLPREQCRHVKDDNGDLEEASALDAKALPQGRRKENGPTLDTMALPQI
jgi:hypothetical protein